MEKKVKQILFKIGLEGRGIVNFDDSEQVNFLNNHCGTMYFHDNYKCGKKIFTKKKESDITFRVDKNGKKWYNDMDFKLKISSYCVKSAMFNDTMDGYNSNISLDDNEFSHFVSSEYGLLRGFLGVDKRIGTYNKKSALELCDAIETSGAVPFMEINTRKGNKDTSSDEKSTSLFYQETVGDTQYESKGCIDLKELQFISCDPVFGRLMFNPSWLEGEEPLIDKQFIAHYGCVPYDKGYYRLSTSTFTKKMGERGLKFKDEFVVKLVRMLLKRLLYARVNRSNAYAVVNKLQIKLIDKLEFNAYNNEEGWIDVDEDVIDNLDFVPFEFYEELDKEEVIESNKNIENLISEKKEIKKAKNSNKGKAKDDKKE